MSIKYNFIEHEEAYNIIKQAEHLKYYVNNKYEQSRIPKPTDLRDYSHQEIGLILNKLHELFINDNIKIDPKIKSINFIKTRDNMDWNFPYTFITNEHNVIVFTSKFLNNNKKILKSTLYHEIIHLEQKNNFEFYENIYLTKLDFHKIYIENYNILNDYITTNPDGFYKDNYLYVYKINNKYVFPFLDNKLEDKIVNIDKINNNYYINLKTIRNLHTEPAIIYKYKLPNKTYLIDQLYHPNEVYAHLKVKHLMHT